MPITQVSTTSAFPLHQGHVADGNSTVYAGTLAAIAGGEDSVNGVIGQSTRVAIAAAAVAGSSAGHARPDLGFAMDDDSKAAKSAYLSMHESNPSNTDYDAVTRWASSTNGQPGGHEKVQTFLSKVGVGSPDLAQYVSNHLNDGFTLPTPVSYKAGGAAAAAAGAAAAGAGVSTGPSGGVLAVKVPDPATAAAAVATAKTRVAFHEKQVEEAQKNLDAADAELFGAHVKLAAHPESKEAKAEVHSAREKQTRATGTLQVANYELEISKAMLGNANKQAELAKALASPRDLGFAKDDDSQAAKKAFNSRDKLDPANTDYDAVTRWASSTNGQPGGHEKVQAFLSRVGVGSPDLAQYVSNHLNDGFTLPTPAFSKVGGGAAVAAGAGAVSVASYGSATAVTGLAIEEAARAG